MTSENVLSADNQQERLRQLHPWYISGFTDGEGSFHVAIYQDKNMKTSIKFIPEFHISQNYFSIQVLKEIKEFYECGNIKQNHRGRKSDQTYVFVVRNRYDLLTKIIPFFQKYSFKTEKENDFKIFTKIVKMMGKNEHKTFSGAKKIILLAYKMNNNGKNRKTK